MPQNHSSITASHYTEWCIADKMFSQQWRCQLCSSGLWYHEVFYEVTNIPQKYNKPPTWLHNVTNQKTAADNIYNDVVYGASPMCQDIIHGTCPQISPNTYLVLCSAGCPGIQFCVHHLGGGIREQSWEFEQACRQKVMPWLRWLVTGLSPRRPRFAPWPVPVGFMVDKVALGQGFLQVV
jgi:hypothetical protein